MLEQPKEVKGPFIACGEVDEVVEGDALAPAVVPVVVGAASL